MSTRQCVAGTVIGAVVVYVVGYILFETLLKDFYASNAGSATGVLRDAPVIWAMLAGAAGYAALIVVVLTARTASLNVTGGIKAGATVGFLLWLCADFTFFGSTNMQNLTLTVVDPVVETVRGGITGAVLAAVLPRFA